MKHARNWCLSSASLAVALLAGPLAAASVEVSTMAAPDGLQEALLAVSFNGSRAGEPVVLLRAAGGALYVPADLLQSWRLQPGAAPSVTRGGIRYHLLTAIAGLTAELDEESQELKVTARPEAIGMTRIAYARVEPTDEVVGGKGAFLNYDATAQIANGDTSFGSVMEAGIFNRLGVGLTSFVSRWSDQSFELTRLATSWTIDDPVKMRSLRLGDSISRGGVGGGPLHFAGVQLARNFAVQPGFVTIPLPTVRGSAALPSVVDIYVNDALVGSREVEPGPFEITNVPIVTGNGDVQLVVRDLLGRDTLYSQSYYTLPQLLRQGLDDYSYEAGFLRRSYGSRSNHYGALMISGTHRYGLTDRFTGEVHAEVTTRVQSAGVAGDLVLPGIGYVQGSIATSRSALGQAAMAGFGFNRRTRGYSVAVYGEFTTAGYQSVGRGEENRPAASTIQAFVGVPIKSSSLGLSYLRRDGRSEPDVEHLGASSSVNLGRFGSIHLSARKSLTGKEDVAAALLFVRPLGGSTSTSAGVSLTEGAPYLNAAINRNLPVGNGFGYQVAASSGAVRRIEGKLSYQTNFGTYGAHLTWTDGKTGIRLSTAGGLGLVDGQAFASRQLNQSFATVKVGEYPDVRVYADNQLVGKTNRRGFAVVPRLRPFDSNTLRIEVADLPWDAEIDGEERTVRPFNRHGVPIDFAVKAARAAIIRILLEDGSPLPAGTTVRLAAHPGEFVSAPGGDVYLTGLEAENTVVASWSAGSCQLRFRYVETGDPQPRLGDFVCASRPTLLRSKR